jgi:hypothetical protein
MAIAPLSLCVPRTKGRSGSSSVPAPRRPRSVLSGQYFRLQAELASAKRIILSASLDAARKLPLHLLDGSDKSIEIEFKARDDNQPDPRKTVQLCASEILFERFVQTAAVSTRLFTGFDSGRYHVVWFPYSSPCVHRTRLLELLRRDGDEREAFAPICR